VPNWNEPDPLALLDIDSSPHSVQRCSTWIPEPIIGARSTESKIELRGIALGILRREERSTKRFCVDPFPICLATRSDRQRKETRDAIDLFLEACYSVRETPPDCTVSPKRSGYVRPPENIGTAYQKLLQHDRKTCSCYKYRRRRRLLSDQAMDHEVIGLPDSCNTGDWLCLLHGGYEIFILRPPKDPNTLDAPRGQLQ
jgi:hypothetical protein